MVLYNGSLSAHELETFAPIKRSRELLELLTWCHRNNVIDSSTRLALHPGISDLTEFELFNLQGALQQSIALPLAMVDEDVLLSPSVPREILLLVNVGVDPLRHHKDLNILMTTERTDSLSYAGVRENLVLTFDQITLNSWNEVLVNRFDGAQALLDCLTELLNGLPEKSARPVIRVRCFCHNRAQAIAQRVEELIGTAQLLLDRRLNHRYLIQVEQRYHVLEMIPARSATSRSNTCRRSSAISEKSFPPTARFIWTRRHWTTRTCRCSSSTVSPNAFRCFTGSTNPMPTCTCSMSAMRYGISRCLITVSPACWFRCSAFFNR